MNWKVIDNFSNYSVSDTGYVRNNVTDKTLAYRRAGMGYFKVTLCKDGKHYECYIHRLVANAFIPNPANKPQVNHIDGNKQNNSISNLEWVTDKENKQHLYSRLDTTETRKKMSLSRRGAKNGYSHKVIRLEDKKVYDCVGEAAREIGVHRACVSDVCRGKQKTTGGFHFMYLEKYSEGLADNGHIGE